MSAGWTEAAAGTIPDPDGALKVSEWVEIDDSWYYFNEDGIMLTNCEVDGKWLNPDGKLAGII